MRACCSKAQAQLYRSTALAFLGDSVYEILVRRNLLLDANQASAKYHDKKVDLVCAEFQAMGVDKIMPVLTEDEIAVYRRGKNAAVTVPRHTSAIDYHKATGLEALFGYLYLAGDEDRLETLFAKIIEN